MDTLKNETQRKANRSHTFTFLGQIIRTTEVKATVVLSLLGLITIIVQPKFLDTKMSAISEFRVQNIKNTISNYLDEKPIALIGTKVKLDLEIVNEKYSFKHTSLGFDTKNLKFIEKTSKESAEHSILKLLPKNLKVKAKHYIKSILKISERHQVDPLWVISVMWTESHFQPFVSSHVGAHGLMQLMPRTRKFMYRTFRKKGSFLVVEEDQFLMKDYFDLPITQKNFNKYVKKLVNIELGVIYLKRLLKKFNYNHRLATVAYNMGPGWTRKRIRRNLPVGNDNMYLNKVRRAYKFLVKRI
jgi:soluble lytic murein transglycosylase-like protein